MRYLKPLLALMLLGTIVTLIACERAPDPNKYPLTSDQVLADLPGRAVSGLDGGELKLDGPIYTEGFDVTYSGRTGEARLLLRAINPGSKQGVDGDVTARYEFRDDVWYLSEVVATPEAGMRPAYAKRLTELVDFPLHFAANIGDRAKVVELLDQGVAVNAPEGVKESTAVMFASERGFLPIVKLLIDNGADVTIPNKFSYTALHGGTSGNHLEVVKLLLANGADVNAADDRGRTPLFIAAEIDSLELARLLKEHGADLDAQDLKLWTPLYAAIDRGSLEVARFLIGQGVQVKSETDQSSRSPLLVASFSGNADMVRLLLEAGADVNARIGTGHSHYRGMTALQIAKKQGHAEVVELLKSAGAR